MLLGIHIVIYIREISRPPNITVASSTATTLLQSNLVLSFNRFSRWLFVISLTLKLIVTNFATTVKLSFVREETMKEIHR